MIAKAVKGRGFRGALDCDLNKENPFVLAKECEGRVAPAASTYLAMLEQERWNF